MGRGNIANFNTVGHLSNILRPECVYGLLLIETYLFDLRNHSIDRDANLLVAHCCQEHCASDERFQNRYLFSIMNAISLSRV